MVAFFIPDVADEAEAEHLYQATRKNVGAPADGPRIRALSWHHNGQAMSCKVGGPLPAYYRTEDEPVVAIFDARNHYVICTASRGVRTGEAVLAAKDFQSNAWTFDS